MHRRPRLIPVSIAAAAAALALLAAACSDDGSTDTGSPTTDEPTGADAAAPEAPTIAAGAVEPESVGLDPAVLESIAAEAEVGKSNCLLVAREGEVAGEWYFRGTGPDSAQNVFSVTKSVTSVLVGIAQDDGDLSIDDPASKWIPEWKGTPAEAVTVRDLLSNDSGREWSPLIDYVQLIQAPDKTAFAVGLPQTEPPGEVWAYNNSAIQTLEAVLEGATGQDVVQFAQERLFERLGMDDSMVTTDAAGNAQTFQGVQSTCRDMARFGQLMLNGGGWGDEQIVSSEYVEAATGQSSTDLNRGYGYLWWLNREGAYVNALVATDLDAADNPGAVRVQIAPDAPDDMYWALGLGNQVVQVDLGSRTVVVRLGTSEFRPQPPTFGPQQASRVVSEAVTGE
jgi:CubicO group peptidase (beta-lactamase class C family)